MKTLGIIGGFGPGTTAKFQMEIVKLFRDKKIMNRPSMIMWNAPIPLIIEENLVLHERDSEKFIPYLTHGAQILEKAGSDFLVLPCNTLHLFIKQIKNAVHIPVISLLDAVVDHLTSQHIKHIGLFATQMTIEKKLYSEVLHDHSIQIMLPPKQKLINEAIFCILQKNDTNRARILLQSVSRDMVHANCHDVLLACTDIQLALQQAPGLTVHDTMQILAEATVEELLI